MVVCHCLRVSDATIMETVERGAETIADVTDACDAGGGCGRCWPVLQMMLACAGAVSQAA